MLSSRAWFPVAASTLAYFAITAFLGRDVLLHLSTTIAVDPGDPLFTAAILKWNATHVPLSDAWWQFPIFYPTRDALAFSEHLLGLSLIASPIYWLTGDTLFTYNIVMLLTFPLCALTMYALVYRLTGSAAGAFVAGLAFGFAPYRMSQLPHVQVLASFAAPLALLGLHSYLSTTERRWLVLYGACWLVQSATSAYSLIFFSIFVGLWVLWFVVANRRWRAFTAVAAATCVAALPLIPVVYRYMSVHAFQGFTRSTEDAQAFSADILSVFCAPSRLSFWNWMRAGCYPESGPLEVELFPGLTVMILCSICLWHGLRRVGARRAPRILTWARIVFAAIAISAFMSVAVDLLHGPWSIDLGFARMSSSSPRKPLLVGLTTVTAAMLLSPRLIALTRSSSTTGFYLLAAGVTWLLTLGPTVSFMGVPSGVEGPFELVRWLPGTGGIRVPGRFWSLTYLCLAVVAGTSFAALVRGRSKPFVWGAIALAGAGIAADGWIERIPAALPPLAIPSPAQLAGQTVIDVPVDEQWRDIAATFNAVEGGWTTVNGYSGYAPSYYRAIADAIRAENQDFLLPFQRAGELHVLVSSDLPALIAAVERQPGVTLTARNSTTLQYRLPQRRLVDPLPTAGGRRVAIAALASPCDARDLSRAIDDDDTSVWACEPDGASATLTVDLGAIHTVGRVVHGLGRYTWLVPKRLQIETSEDGSLWREAWSGQLLEEAIAAGLATPSDLRIVAGFTARRARFVRLTGAAADQSLPWAIAELEIWSGPEAP